MSEVSHSERMRRKKSHVDRQVAAADTVSEMRMVKHAFAAGVKAMPGVEF